MDYLIPFQSDSVWNILLGETEVEIPLTHYCRWWKIKVGDRILVQERVERDDDEVGIRYAVDRERHPDGNWAWETKCALTAPFMPRGLCRIFLRVVDLRRKSVDAMNVTVKREA